jgi:HD-GYP domain-containing protein (c-di-GMP phosphodiesterase class II)
MRTGSSAGLRRTSTASTVRRHSRPETYLVVVRNWGQSIESADRYTFGHCERVATCAESVARALGLDALEQTTIRVGAYLHDVEGPRPHRSSTSRDRSRLTSSGS